MKLVFMVSSLWKSLKQWFLQINWNGDMTSLDQMLALLHTGTIHHIIVHHLSNISRQLQLQGQEPESKPKLCWVQFQRLIQYIQSQPSNNLTYGERQTEHCTVMFFFRYFLSSRIIKRLWPRLQPIRTNNLQISRWAWGPPMQIYPKITSHPTPAWVTSRANTARGPCYPSAILPQCIGSIGFLVVDLESIR